MPRDALEEAWLQSTLDNLCGTPQQLQQHSTGTYLPYAPQAAIYPTKNAPTPPPYQKAGFMDLQSSYPTRLPPTQQAPPTAAYPSSYGPRYAQHKEDYFAFKHTPPALVVDHTLHSTVPQQSGFQFGYPAACKPAAPPHQPYFGFSSSAPVSSFEQQPPPASHFQSHQFNPTFSSALDQFVAAKVPAPEKSIAKKKITVAKKSELPRRVRPKVVEAKGSVQCAGTNLKKGTQCKNAALMEFIGPRPIYCAEHIELDPQSVYCKCNSPYGKEPGDGKSCKEVVLKEFQFCYKHFEDRLATLDSATAMDTATKEVVRAKELLKKLEAEAIEAKRKRHDLFQRKNKLIPKFVKMISILEDFIASDGALPVEVMARHAPTAVNESLLPTTMPYQADNQTLGFSENFLDGQWKSLFSELDS